LEATPLLILFSFTLFISAFLLFWVQLMVAKMILPLLGGSPSVWNTCLFFFQATLLLGYGYSHLTTMWWSVRRQAAIHSSLLLVVIAFLPITLAKGWVPPHDANPIPWLLALLLLSVGFPFFVVATSAPLLQKWFAHTDHPASSDPYFLYAASNFGSLLGAIGYPILIEPNFSLTYQRWLWASTYGLLALLILGCAVCVWRSRNDSVKVLSSKDKGKEEELTQNSKLKTQNFSTTQQKAQWVLLSFLPSSLLLGVTTYLTTDLAAIPLLWAVPLAIYLLSFILTFARKPLLPHKALVAILPLLLAPLIILSLLKVMQPIEVLLPFHLIGFFIVACVFHGQLAQTRPPSEYLTSFYWWISVGGVFGGLFNAIAAPLLFPTVLEYPLILGLSLLLLGIPSSEEARQKTKEEIKAKEIIQASLLTVHSLGNYPALSKRHSWTLPISIGLLLGSLIVGFQIKSFNNNLIGIIFAFILLFAIRYAFTLHPIRFGVGLALIVLLSQFYIPSMGAVLDTERSFFGVNRVLYDRRENYHSLLHGTTLHGKQSLDPKRRREPLTYFYPTGPIGQVFKVLNNTKRLSHIGVMGLGIGTLAAYAEPTQQWTFYEIDPTVDKLAHNSRYFTFLQDSKAQNKIVLGDARLAVADVENDYYDLIIMDAFSSDSIPVHLVTREAIQLYFSKLTKQGLLVINISNRYINLEPVLSTLARNLDLSTLRQLELNVSPDERKLGKSPSHWVLLARNRSDFGNLINDPRWQPIAETLQAPLWTDDFSNIFSALRVFQ
jgi:hypothetical protein